MVFLWYFCGILFKASHLKYVCFGWREAGVRREDGGIFLSFSSDMCVFWGRLVLEEKMAIAVGVFGICVVFDFL